jgi:hypothetical protein
MRNCVQAHTYTQARGEWASSLGRTEPNLITRYSAKYKMRLAACKGEFQSKLESALGLLHYSPVVSAQREILFRRSLLLIASQTSNLIRISAAAKKNSTRMLFFTSALKEVLLGATYGSKWS